MYGIGLHANKDRYFTIGDNKHQKFSFLPFKEQTTVIRTASVHLELERFKSEQLSEAEISLYLTNKQENELSCTFTLPNKMNEIFSENFQKDG
ncbi:hypothetical protein O181_099243 [Austropuccinia psidii MF-1]|uniref:Uncharacterized protein n=1 Tax=Austropuccinia psidii MF-1 TaxID=1389203 RepID=A0A9Q3JCB6_9BASI|nr:hypothetical protein [Austropuccinia psidii MF-1]